MTGTERDIYLKCRDHSVSGESFVLLKNTTYDMLETDPKPGPDILHQYYESDNYISHTDANNSWMDRIYQRVKRHTLKNKLKLINSFKTDGRLLLDIGCGTGDFLLTCSDNNWEVTGVEPNNNARHIAEDKLPASSNLFTTLPGTDKKYDVITLWHALEHVTDLTGYISFLKKTLKPDGRILVAVPNFKSFDAKYYESFWAAYDVPRHLWHFSKLSIEKLFSEKELKLEKTKPMLYDSFYVSLLSEKYKKRKFQFFSAFFIGLVSNLAALRSNEYSSRIYILKHA